MDQELIDNISEIVTWYKGLPSDYTGINELMYARVQLSTNLFLYATEMGRYRIAWKSAEAEAEREKRKSTNDYLEQGYPLTKAQEYGKFHSLDHFVLEKQYDGTFGSMKLFYDSSQAILETLNQHISNLKKEYEETKNT
jgi:hypothetical protein